MVSALCFYPLVLVALVWLCLMLYWAWPSDTRALWSAKIPSGESKSLKSRAFASIRSPRRTSLVATLLWSVFGGRSKLVRRYNPGDHVSIPVFSAHWTLRNPRRAVR